MICGGRMRSFLLFMFFAAAAAVASAAPFEWKAENVNGKLVVSVKVDSGYYLALDSVLTEIKDGNGKLPPILSAPEKQWINDPDAGKTAILPAGFWQWTYGGIPPYQVKVAFQGCRKAGAGEPAICLMPQELLLTGAKTPIAAAEKTAVKDFYRSWKIVKKHSGAMDKKEFLQFLLFA